MRVCWRRRAARAVLALAAGFGVPAAHAGAPLTTPGGGAGGGVPLRWDVDSFPGGGIPYLVQPDPPPGAIPIAPAGHTTVGRIDAVRAAFQVWSNAPQARVRFRYDGVTVAANDATDLRNVVTFAPQAFSFPPGFAGGVFPVLTYALAAGPVAIPGGPTVVARFAGQLLDADVVINPQGSFTVATTGPDTTGRYDLQGVLTHEIGHFAGLDHDCVQGATLYCFYTLSGGFFQRTPETTEEIGLGSLYPEPAWLESTGRIHGRVERPDGTPVFGAQVLALDANGVIASSTLSGVAETDASGLPSRFAGGFGDFVLAGLATGAYYLAAEPLDGPGLPYLSGVFGTGTGGISTVETAFDSASFPTLVSVTAGGSTAVPPLVVAVRGPAAPNLEAYGFALVPGGPSQSPAFVVPGLPATWSSGVGVGLVEAGAIVPGASFTVSGSDVAVGTPEAGGGGILLPLGVAAGAALGPRLLSVTTPGGAAAFAGAISVVASATPLDADDDGMPEDADDCPGVRNRSQADADGDGVGDACDVCPTVPDAGQVDTGGVGLFSGPDGIGNACQCGDVNADGRVTLGDAVLIQRSRLVPPTAALAQPQLCDVGGTAGCTVTDAALIRRALLQPPTASLLPRCTPAL